MKDYTNASTLKRFINWIIDSLVIGALWLGIFILTGKLIAKYGIPDWIEVGKKYDLSLTLLITFLPYYLIFEGVFKTTLGKLITRTKVIRLDGNSISFYKGLARTLCRLIPLEPFSYLLKKDFGWHDSITGTRVVDK
ncbi:MAG: RDD family protein [Bacteroidales bacterium]